VTFAFTLLRADAGPVGPRLGRLTTAHGSVATPVFMPVGTMATVKAVLPEEVRGTGAEILLVNAYHLYLRPGHETVAALGGVHRFMDWHGPILSDSGGFQVFSLAGLRKVTEEGVRFRSHHDGSEHLYTPEVAMAVQTALGVDIAMPLDHVVAGDTSPTLAKEAAERTVRWYERSRRAAGPLTTFAIVQGGTDPELRRWHARTLASLGAPGYSIGGLSVGEAKEAMWAMAEAACAELPEACPRYLMGVGSPEDLVEGVARGIDMFDCVLPTRLGRNGALFTAEGRVNIANARFARQEGPVEEGCDCLGCSRFSAAYLHHLFRNEELLGYRLATIHNVRFLVQLMGEARAAIAAGEFGPWAEEFRGRYRVVDGVVRAEQRARWAAGRRKV
jgi:queuine tRNA-ribosyltransferase